MKRARSSFAVRIAALGVAIPLLGMGQNAPSGPVPIVFEHERCAECHMHISDRAFAAQIDADDGVRNFDDPGCLLLYVDRHPTPGARIWFHHHKRDLWISAADVRFVRVRESPMGYGLGAVGPRWQGAMSRADAIALLRRPRAEPAGGHHGH